MRIVGKLSVCLLVLLAGAVCQEVLAQGRTDKFIRVENRVANKYIVVLDDSASGGRGFNSRAAALASEMSAVYGGRLGRVFQHAVNGFSVEMSEARARALSSDPRVAFVEEDAVVTIAGTQTNATWGLDRIDQRNLPLDGSYTSNADGSNVKAYILDTGIRASHADFGNRVGSGYTAINDGRGTGDCNGHGTHVAGTVGGSTWGVAKNVTLVPVRVLNCQGSGTTSGVVAGIDWVTSDHASGPAVANMSLGGSASSTIDTAVANSINDGVTYAVAAGNSSANACNYSPARVGAAITVGATTSGDARASYSNYGSCLDIFAPGSSITSAWYNSDTATSTISGTSMASPHVAGVAALYLQVNPAHTPSQVRNAVVAAGTIGKVTSAGTGSPNVLLFSLFGGGGGGGNQSPTASFTFTCTELVCNFNGSASSDPDGTISSYSWNFGDGTSEIGPTATVTKTYGSGGTRTVTLTVTDDGQATGSISQSVTTTATGASITLNVSMRKVTGFNYADLSWSGSSGSTDVFRNGSKVTTVNTTTYTDQIGRGGGSRTYQVCSAGICSNSVTVNY